MNPPTVCCPWCGPSKPVLWTPIIEKDGTVTFECARCWLPYPALP